MYQQLWGHKVEEKLYLGVREQKKLNTTGLDNSLASKNYFYRQVNLHEDVCVTRLAFPLLPQLRRFLLTLHNR
jgi:hypothetical protein